MNDELNLHNVLTLPIEIFTVSCQTDNPLILPLKPGATPGTTIFGSFGEVLLNRHCKHNKNCLKTHSGFQCQQPQNCAARWLYKPYSDVHRRHFPRPVFIYSRELENRTPTNHFTLHITLWGRQAIKHKKQIQQDLIALSEKGFLLNGQAQCFKISHFSKSTAQTLANIVDQHSQQSISNALFLFETPLRYREKIRHPNGRTESFWLAAGEPPIRELIANSAYELAAWYLEDSQQTEFNTKEQRHQYCQATKQHVLELLKETYPADWLLHPTSVGQRYSKTEQCEFQLDGFRGFTELKGKLEKILPWIIVLALQGGGQNRAMGFGRIRLILNGQSVTPPPF